jgi:hypothetical protein
MVPGFMRSTGVLINRFTGDTVPRYDITRTELKYYNKQQTTAPHRATAVGSGVGARTRYYSRVGGCLRFTVPGINTRVHSRALHSTQQ